MDCGQFLLPVTLSPKHPITLYRLAVVKGSSATWRARLMAVVSER